MAQQSRISRLREELLAGGHDAAVVTAPADVRYLTGFTGSNASVLVLARGRRSQVGLFTDGRYTAQARDEAPQARIHIVQGPVLRHAADAALAAGAWSLVYDSAATTVAALDELVRHLRAGWHLPRNFLRPQSGLLSRLREIKDADELLCLRRAASLTCDLYDGMLSFIEPGMREIDVAAELERRARQAGADSMSFETIVASGARGGLPHGRATQAILQPGTMVTLDFGIILGGYCSDMTRTLFLKSRPVFATRKRARGASVQNSGVERQREVFHAVLEAQEAAVSAVRAGAAAASVDSAARTTLRRHGLAKYFTHSTGHGLGLEIHESPRIAANVETPLQEGMVVTVEPGAYLPGAWGVRIEDTVAVTAEGCENLTPAYKGWIEI